MQDAKSEPSITVLMSFERNALVNKSSKKMFKFVIKSFIFKNN